MSANTAQQQPMNGNGHHAVGGGADVQAAPAQGGTQLAGTPFKGGRRSRKGLVHFKKGSKEAKEFMAKLRAMRGKTRKGKGKKMGGNPAAVGGVAGTHATAVGGVVGAGQVPAGGMKGGEKTCSNGATVGDDEECPDSSQLPGTTVSKDALGDIPQDGGKRRRKSNSAKKGKKAKGGRKSKKNCGKGWW